MAQIHLKEVVHKSRTKVIPKIFHKYNEENKGAIYIAVASAKSEACQAISL
jgi:hypothetical protein